MQSKISVSNKILLWCGVLAGPIYILESVFQILTRDGFDVTKHSWSVLSNGDMGWLHILNFLITGTFTILGAIGIGRLLKGSTGSKWAPRLIMVYGIFLILSGIFKADPANGFPPGTPLGSPTTVSTSGILHLVFGMFGFIALISSCIIFSKYFRRVKNQPLAQFSLITGVYFLIGFLSLMMGGMFGTTGSAISILAFSLAVILSWSWYSLLSWSLLKGKI